VNAEPRDRIVSPTAAVLTPPGPAGIAVVAVRGADADLARVAAALFRPRSRRPAELPAAGRIAYGDFVAGGAALDDGLLCRGEDGSLELHVHGGAAVIAGLLAALRGLGVDTAGEPAPGPTSLRDEVLAVLPRLTTWRAVEIVAAQADAGLAAAARRGDLGAIRPLSVGRRLIEPAAVAIVGRPNVGKSTLGNALFGREHSIVTDVPGTTRDYVDAPADLLGFAVRLIDTAGRRDTTDPVEAEGVRRSVEQARAADVVVLVLDGSAPPTAEDRALLAEFGGDPRCVRVLNKADLPAAWIEPDAVRVSAAAGTGLDDLRFAVLERLGLADLTPDTAVVFSPRQQRLLDAARAAGDEPTRSAALEQLL
jgi:tRNA modification GTPase